MLYRKDGALLIVFRQKEQTCNTGWLHSMQSTRREDAPVPLVVKAQLLQLVLVRVARVADVSDPGMHPRLVSEAHQRSSTSAAARLCAAPHAMFLAVSQSLKLMEGSQHMFLTMRGR